MDSASLTSFLISKTVLLGFRRLLLSSSFSSFLFPESLFLIENALNQRFRSNFLLAGDDGSKYRDVGARSRELRFWPLLGAGSLGIGIFFNNSISPRLDEEDSNWHGRCQRIFSISSPHWDGLCNLRSNIAWKVHARYRNKRKRTDRALAQSKVRKTALPDFGIHRRHQASFERSTHRAI